MKLCTLLHLQEVFKFRYVLDVWLTANEHYDATKMAN